MQRKKIVNEHLYEKSVPEYNILIFMQSLGQWESISSM